MPYWPALELPAGCLDRRVWLDRLADRLRRLGQDADVRVMRAQVRRVRELTRDATALERELLALVRALQPELPGGGALTTAKLIAEIAGIERFRSQAKLAQLTGIAPIPASSGDRSRFRLDRAGNRQLNAAIHRMAFTQLGATSPPRTTSRAA